MISSAKFIEEDLRYCYCISEMENNVPLIKAHLFLFYNISMKFTLILALLLALSAAQQNACQTCLKIKQCDPSLFSDYNIDPIYISITKQLNLN